VRHVRRPEHLQTLELISVSGQGMSSVVFIIAKQLVVSKTIL
jgi:hypothetical protein